MKTVQITGKAVKKFEDGYPQLAMTDLENPADFQDGEWVQLESHGHFVAIAYFAKERKGAGWIFTLHENERIDDRFFASLFRGAMARRRHLADLEAYCWFNGAGDGLGGLTIDKYLNAYLFKFDNRALFLQRDLIIEGFNEVMASDIALIVSFNGNQELVMGSEDELPKLVHENEVVFPINLMKGQDLGLEFRDVREMVKPMAPQKSVLNVFDAETGLIPVAMVGDATNAVTVDPAARATKITQEQLLANNADQAPVEIRTMDVENYLDYAIKHHLTFDLVTVNPPNFIRGKKREFRLTKDLVSLMEQIFSVVAPGTKIILSITSPSFSMKRLRKEVNEAVANSGIQASVENTFSAPDDFPVNRSQQHSEAIKGIILTIH
ncbi:class I SAM-dependent methyltransferase [Levilactobacillus bambusae]|uniref:Class I SAM-dependent rRNA methyltransferase n=1 Tax=Levilactobacillus bambusae TaxID=2024736 RepID=A0A2V1MWU0_9LACO|nr:class I SAM-dependent methyltransferase [Levilactobacillus bambusae]PWF99506.1 class I SAM-dependent rRNA methyltransferase [Levilactobacillus bambusae]